jgi:hypothetical protein
LEMLKKTASLFLVLMALLFMVAFGEQTQTLLCNCVSSGNLTTLESQLISEVNGTETYDYALELEKIALNRSVSGYSFRAGGSAGATASAMWIKKQFENFGLETRLESFEFTNWNLPSPPTLVIDEDGALDTTEDQVAMDSFQSEHYSWPTPEGGVFADLVVLPLPPAAHRNEIGATSINTTLWNTINTSGKIVLVGREVRWSPAWEQDYESKLAAQTPAAVVYTWWYQWMSDAPPTFSSVGGRPASSLGPYYWDLEIPTGSVNYNQGWLIRERENSANVSAKVTISSIISSGPHYNVVGELRGNTQPEKFVIISGHYDSVMTAGFLDNAAGTAGVLELARVFSHATREGLFNSGCTLLFVALASEELGLVGATYYVKQHKAEMKDIVAVVNLDCIGNDNLNVTKTEPTADFDLDELVLKTATDLGIAASLAEPGGSDHEIFLNPREGENIFSFYWPSLEAGIRDAAAVKSSTMLISNPLFFSDKWSQGVAGWIHTSYDNSTSTHTLNWLEIEDLEAHVEVAALTIVRVSPSSQGVTEFFPYTLLGAGVAVAVTAVIIGVIAYFVRVRKQSQKTLSRIKPLDFLPVHQNGRAGAGI